MKRISLSVITLMASLLMLFFGCSEQSNTEETVLSNESSAEILTDDSIAADSTASEVIELQESMVYLNCNTPGIKILGVRNLKSDTTINCDWTCSGIEFTADCVDDMIINVNSTDSCYFRVFVDGETYKSDGKSYFKVFGLSKITIKDLPQGIHNIRIIKVTGYTLSRANFVSIKIKGTIQEQAPADKELYIEFVGDSISCGWGTIGDHDGKYNSQDGAIAYPYLVSQKLNADYSITALSGQGLCCGSPGVVLGYKYACYHKDSANEYDFARKADAVVINIGTNDYSRRNSENITEELFASTLSGFINTVKEKNGDDCVVLLLYNCMNDTFADAICRVANEMGGEESNVYICKLDRAAGNAHPSMSEHSAYTKEIAGILETILIK